MGEKSVIVCGWKVRGWNVRGWKVCGWKVCGLKSLWVKCIWVKSLWVKSIECWLSFPPSQVLKYSCAWYIYTYDHMCTAQCSSSEQIQSELEKVRLAATQAGDILQLLGVLLFFFSAFSMKHVCKGVQWVCWRVTLKYYSIQNLALIACVAPIHVQSNIGGWRIHLEIPDAVWSHDDVAMVGSMLSLVCTPLQNYAKLPWFELLSLMTT